jgi:transcriptional regulator with PAS, ATPase and Fis domain
LQKKLLRFLQEKEFVRVGGTKRRKVDVRILAATNKDLEAEVQSGTWREDLFYRLNVITIHIPPLRERKEDISLLVNFFLDKYNAQNQRSIQGVTNDVHKVFELYEWPGNVRELENVIERGVVLCTGDMITLNCLPPKLAELDEEQDAGDGLNLMEVEKRLIVRALDQEGGNQSAAARTLGISRKQLRTKMTHHGLL